MKIFSRKNKNNTSSFHRAFINTRKEMGISLIVLLFITLTLALIFYLVEQNEQPNVFDKWSSCIVWAYSRYIEGGDGVFEGGPVTVAGRIIAFLLGITGIAIVAIPAGIIGSGFMDAIADEKREKELETFQKRIIKSFPVTENRNLKLWIAKNLPHVEGAWYEGVKFKFIANNISLAKLQLKGMEIKDVFDVCEKNSEFRIKNEATAQSSEEGKTDRFMLEYYPVNKPYGFFIDRKSKVTIVSTSSRSELGTGNFSYYLAKFAGFNYISKDFDIDPDDPESFYNNHWDEPKVDDMTWKERETAKEKVSKQMIEIYTKKKELRDAFLDDLERLCKGEDHWVFCILSHIQNQENNVDIHIAHSKADGKDSLVHDTEKYKELLDTLTTTMQEHLQLSVKETERYPLVKKAENGYRNIGYKLQDDGCKCNCMTIRVSSHLMHFDSRMRLALFLMAKTIHDVITPNGEIPKADADDMNRTGHGFSANEQKVRTTEIYKIKD